MNIEQEIVALLSNPGSYPGQAARVDIIETHCARVFLAGNEAYKLKKHVTLPFLDFSSLEQRRRACQREFELNRPFAPGIYLGVVPIAREPSGTLRLGGNGEVVDWAVHMRRFDQSALLSTIAEQRPLEPPLARKLAAMVSSYHRACTPVAVPNASMRVLGLVTELARELDKEAEALSNSATAAFGQGAREALARCQALIEARASHGSVRRCHGDLHLGNIVLIEGAPVPFDALEFDEDLATIDVLYDLAFLLMDLDRRDATATANVVLNGYLAESSEDLDIEGLACLPLFLACRAAVRAVVALERSHQEESDKARAQLQAARRLLAAANAYLAPPRAELAAIGGLSGTGKSTLAAALAPHVGACPGAIHVRSDVERKLLFGVPETARLPAAAYTSETSAKVYDLVERKAARILSAGHGAIADAVFALPEERQSIEQVAHSSGRRFFGLWLEAPLAELISRVEGRTHDASDAGPDTVRMQLGYDVGPMCWSRIDASGTPQEVLARALARLRTLGLLPRNKDGSAGETALT